MADDAAAPTDPEAPTAPPVIRVLLVDDHPLWRETLRKVLQRHSRIEVVAGASTGPQALQLAEQHRPDVVLMDIDLPGLDGIQATVRLRGDLPGISVLMLSAATDRSVVIDAVRAGASGYLVKTAGASEVADAVIRVSEGELAFSPELAPVVLAAVRGGTLDDAVAGIDALTDGERLVLDLMAAGRSNQAIADHLHVSLKTVEARVTSIYGKLELEPAAGDHRRVLAVLQYLDGVRGDRPPPHDQP